MNTRWIRIAGAALVFLSVAGCSQGEGDRCQVNSDCDEGLLCVIPPDSDPLLGGTCAATPNIDAGLEDLGT